MEQDLRQGSRTETMTPIRGKSRGPRGEIVTLPGQTAAGRVDSSIRGGDPRSVAPRGHERVWLGLPKTFRYLTEPFGTFRGLSEPFGAVLGRRTGACGGTKVLERHLSRPSTHVRRARRRDGSQQDDPTEGIMERIRGRGPWKRSMEEIHGRGPWKKSMEEVHGRDRCEVTADEADLRRRAGSVRRRFR